MHTLLTSSERETLLTQLKKAKMWDERGRIMAVLAYDENLPMRQIAKNLYLDLKTVHHYINEYKKEQKTKNDPRGGSTSKLTEGQTEELKAHLQEHTYLCVTRIMAYIRQQYGIEYTVSGLTKGLKRLGFVYKKPEPLPGKISPEAQEVFVQHYESLRDQLPPEEKIFFIDSTHPAHQSQAVSGWILKGTTKHLKTTGKQSRLHYMGALSLGGKQSPHTMLTRSFPTINQEVVCEFFAELEQAFSNLSTLHLICDNAAYFKGKKVKQYLLTSRIKIHFLPPYSPNLNAIERLWKVMRESVCYNHYYPRFSDFQQAISTFFDSLPERRDQLRVRLNDHFQRLVPKPILLAL